MNGNRVLLVDDNDFMGIIQTKILEKIGFNVQVVDSGKAALSRLAESSDFDFILMDCQMPEMDGFETTQKIREIQPDLPIYALTGDDDENQRAKAMQAGMSGFLTKPITQRSIQETLDQFIS